MAVRPSDGPAKLSDVTSQGRFSRPASRPQPVSEGADYTDLTPRGKGDQGRISAHSAAMRLRLNA
jgi:hypothetical protein